MANVLSWKNTLQKKVVLDKSANMKALVGIIAGCNTKKYF